MEQIPIEYRLFSGPTRIIIEASHDVILEQDLNPLEGEQYDSIDDVIVIDPDHEGGVVIFETCRTMENPKRERWTFKRGDLEAVYIH